jgi:hypothetical protein
MTIQPHRVEFSVGMVLAVIVTTLAIMAVLGRNWAAPISPTETAIYSPQHLNLY